MKENDTIDASCKVMLGGITNLLEQLEDDLLSSVLELGRNSGNDAKHEELKRLKKGLEHYLSRGSDLFYVGFLGHFSSGKSSMINSILGEKKEETKRATDLNPTDEHITLITHPDNRTRLLGMVREGLVSTRAVFVDSKLLKNLVLMDTPGTGDPKIAEEVVRDSLPLCDMILYALNPTSLFDHTDIPLLKLQQKYLTDIPFRFVVSRADEFRQDRYAPVSESNFDNEKYESTIAVAAARINTELGRDRFTVSEFLAIDNLENFRIDQLREFVLAPTDTSNHEQLIMLHSHKVRFFLEQSRQILSFFQTTVQKKTEFAATFVTQAKLNIEEFQKRVQIGKGELQSELQRCHDEIKRSTDGAIGQLKGTIDTFVLVENVMELEYFNGEQHHATTVLNSEAEEIASRIISDSKSQWARSLTNPEGEDIDMESFKFVPIQVIEERLEFPMNPSTIEDKAVQKIQESVIEGAKARIRALNQLSQRLQKANPLETIEKHIEDAKKRLRSIMKHFFDAVQIYKIAALSSEVKTYISELGLGKKMDTEDESDLDQEYFQASICDGLFSHFDSVRSTFGDGVRDVISSLPAPLAELNRLSTLTVLPEDAEGLLQGEELVSTSQALGQTINFSAKKAMEEALNRYNSEKITINTELEKETQHLNRRRRRRLVFWTGGICLVALTGLLIYFSYDSPAPSTVGVQILISIISEIIVGFGTYFIVKKTDNTEKSKKEIQKNYRLKIKNMQSELLSKATEEFFLAIEKDRKGIRSTILNCWSLLRNGILNSERIEKLEKEYSELCHQNSIFLACHRAYSDAIIGLLDGISKFLLDGSSIEKQLELTSKEIKEKAIEPSFLLLDDTKNNLELADNNLNEIKFS